MANPHPWFPLYAKDLLTSTAAMSAEAVGVYIRLLAVSWENSGVPTDPESCRRIGGVDRENWPRVWSELEAKWPIDGDVRRNPRQEVERQQSLKVQSAKSRGGKTRAAARSAAKQSAQDSAQDSYQESTQESTQESRTHSQSQSQPQITEGETRDSVALNHPLSNPFLPRDAWLSLAQAWNDAAAKVPVWMRVDTGTLPRSSQGLLLKALRECPDLAAWDARFARAARSEWLTGRQPGRDGAVFVADLWWLLENVSKLDAGRYDTRAKSQTRVAGLTGGGVPASQAHRVWVPVTDPDYKGAEYRFHCGHEPTCTTWPQCRDHETAVAP